MDRWHRIKANKARQHPTRCLFLDTETTQKDVTEEAIEAGVLDKVATRGGMAADPEGLLTEHQFDLAVGVYVQERPRTGKVTRKVYYLDTVKETWDLIESLPTKKAPVIVFAHNWRFDMHVLGRLGKVKERGWECRRHIEDNGLFISIWKKDNKTIEFRDTMNYFKTSVAQLGEMVGLPKLGSYDQHPTHEGLFDYCQRDVEILEATWKRFMQFIEDNDLGNVQKTITAQAFGAWSHRFMPCHVYVHDYQPVVELERESYRGGRTEAFALGTFNDGPYYGLDINSMYPYVMAIDEYPTRLLGYEANGSIDKLKRWLWDYCVIARVKVNTPERVFGVRHNGKLKFPVGEFWCVLTTAEITYALVRDYVSTVGEITYYEAGDLFSSYIDEMYQLKQRYKAEGNAPFYDLSKRFMNHLYGKFGQRTPHWEQVGECNSKDFYTETEIDAETGQVDTLRYQDGIVWKRAGYEEGYNSFVAIPAHVTANARMLMWELISTAGENNVFYMDTDSLIVNQQGYDNLADYLDERTLGMVKLERQADVLSVLGNKSYDFSGVHKRKGVKKSARRVGRETYVQQGQLSRNEKVSRHFGNRLVWQQSVRSLTGEYDKGVVLTGGRVKPLVLWTYLDDNLLDIPGMVDTYGGEATYRGKPMQAQASYKDVSRVNKRNARRRSRRENYSQGEAEMTGERI